MSSKKVYCGKPTFFFFFTESAATILTADIQLAFVSQTCLFWRKKLSSGKMFWKKSLWGCKWPTAIERAGEWPTENNNNSSRFMYHLHPTKYFVNWISIWKHNTTFMHTYWSKLPSDLLVELGWPTTRQNTFGGPLCILWYAIHLKYLNGKGGSVLHCATKSGIILHTAAGSTLNISAENWIQVQSWFQRRVSSYSTQKSQWTFASFATSTLWNMWATLMGGLPTTTLLNSR